MLFPHTNRIDPGYFLELAEKIPVVDVRSPSEYIAGHVPGALCIPLFDDKERETFGIRYRKAGRESAILTALDIVGPQLSLKLENALKTAVHGKLLVHCWRGGMRSEAMAWLFSMGGIETKILEGGYKSYRNHIHKSLSADRRMIILGGMTGSGKTQILKQLGASGKQVVDLEAIANHKGSAFGALGRFAQPSSEHFANLLFAQLRHLKQDEPAWIEDESRNIGTVFMPEEFYLNMQDNPAIVLLMDIKTRLPRLIREYSAYPAEELKAGVMRISRRLGGENAKNAIQAIENNDFERAIEITLNYYDKAYLFGLTKNKNRNIYYVNSDTDNVEINTGMILEAAEKITW